MIRSIVLFIIKLCDYDSSTVESLQFSIIFAMILIFCFYRVVLGAMVSRIMNKKNMENPSLWEFMCFLFGLLGVAVCLLINAKTGNDKKIVSIKAFRIGISLLCAFVILFGLNLYFLTESNKAFEITGVKTMMEEYGEVPYFDSDKMVYYCYDKMGNRYIDYDFYVMKYYTKSGSTYYCNNDNGAIGMWYENEAELDKDNPITFEGVIDTKGNAVALDNSFNMYCDTDLEYPYCVECFYKKNGESFDIYYLASDVGWDKDGNFVLNENAKEYTQEKIEEYHQRHPYAKYSSDVLYM